MVLVPVGLLGRSGCAVRRWSLSHPLESLGLTHISCQIARALGLSQSDAVSSVPISCVTQFSGWLLSALFLLLLELLAEFAA